MAHGVGRWTRLAGALAAGALLLPACGGGDDGDDSAETTPAPAPAPEFGSIPFSDLDKCDPLPNKPEYRCGTIEVPFERADASYGTTEIGFAVYPRRDRSAPSEGAIFMVEGGPGYPSSGTGGTFERLMRPLLESHDMVLVDQRGQGLSEQFDCPDLQAGEGPEFVTVAECARRLGDQFISYRTSAAADDIDSVREALGYETIALYGDSYGTFLAQSYAYRHGDRLDALVLDSAYPAFGEDPWYPSLPRTGIRSLGLACDRAPGCDGDAIARLEEGVETLREQRRPVIDAVTALIDASGSPPESYLQLDRALSDLVDGDPTAWEKLVAPARVGIRNDDRYQTAGQWIVSCNDYPMIWDKQRLGARAPGTARGGDRRVPPGRLRAVHHARDRVFRRAPHISPASPSRLRPTSTSRRSIPRPRSRPRRRCWSSPARWTTSRLPRRAGRSRASSRIRSSTWLGTPGTSTRSTRRTGQPEPRFASSWLPP